MAPLKSTRLLHVPHRFSFVFSSRPQRNQHLFFSGLFLDSCFPAACRSVTASRRRGWGTFFKPPPSPPPSAVTVLTVVVGRLQLMSPNLLVFLDTSPAFLLIGNSMRNQVVIHGYDESFARPFHLQLFSCFAVQREKQGFMFLLSLRNKSDYKGDQSYSHEPPKLL